MGVILSTNKRARLVCAACGKTAHELDGELGDGLNAPGSTTFLPYLSGERTPYNDAKYAACVLGLER